VNYETAWTIIMFEIFLEVSFILKENVILTINWNFEYVIPFSTCFEMKTNTDNNANEKHALKITGMLCFGMIFVLSRSIKFQLES
jgi:hypothetical protein